MKNKYIVIMLVALFYLDVAKAQDNTFFMDDNSLVSIQSGATLHVEGDVHMDSNSDLDNAGIINLQGDWRFESTTVDLTSSIGADEQGLINFENNFSGNPHNIGAKQTIYAPADMMEAAAFYDIDINNDGNLLDLSGGSIEVKNTLEFKDANDVVRTDASSHGTAGQDYAHIVYLNNTSPSALVSGSGTANNATGAYIEGKLQWALAAGNTYTFPIAIDGADYTEPFTLAVTAVPANGTVTGYIIDNAASTIGTTIYSDIATHGGSSGVEDFSTALEGADGKLDKVVFDSEYALAWQVDANTGSGWNYTFTGYPGAIMQSETFEDFDSKNIGLLLKDGVPEGGTSASAPTPWTAGTDADGYQVNFNPALLYTYNGASFSTFRVAGSTNLANDEALPVELLSFDGIAEREYNSLSWATASEENSSHFEIEKSKDGLLFEIIGTETARGNSISYASYEYIDRQLQPLAYYRLKMIDMDGSYEYSNIIKIKRTGDKGYANIFPNPTNGLVRLVAGVSSSTNISIYLVDALGRELLTEQMFSNANGELIMDMDMSSFTAGSYILRIVDGEEIMTRVIVKK